KRGELPRNLRERPGRDVASLARRASPRRESGRGPHPGLRVAEELMASVTDIGRQLYVRPQERDALLLAYGRGTAIEGRECEFYRKDGQRLWVLTSGRPVHDDSGQFLFADGFVTDITRHKRAEEQLRRRPPYVTAAAALG